MNLENNWLLPKNLILKSSCIHGSSTVMNWLPIVDLLGYHKYLGVSSGGIWVQEVHDRIIEISTNSNIMPIMGYLEMTPSEISFKILSALLNLGFENETAHVITESFPSKIIIIYALKSFPVYFGFALNWLKVYPCFDDEIVNIILERRKDRSISQKVRHESIIMLKNWQRTII